jgi:hypothetical protein
MTVNIANTANNNTFDYWRNRTNELAYAMSTYAVTVDSNTSVGNASISGTFTANSVVSNSITVNSSITFGNSTSNTFVNSSYLSTGNSTVNTIVNTSFISTYSGVNIGSNVSLNTSSFFIGNSTSNGTLSKDTLYLRSDSTVSVIVNTTNFYITNSTGTASLTPYNLTLGSVVVGNSSITTGAGGITANTTAFTIGSNVTLDSSSVVIGNSTVNSTQTSTNLLLRSSSTVNTIVNSSLIQVSNSTAVSNLTPQTLFIGNSTVNTTVTVGSINVNGATVANTTGVYTGIINAASHTVGSSFAANSTGVYHTGTVNTASYTVGTSFTANSTLVNAVALNIVNQINTATLFVTTTANVGGNIQLTTQGLNITGNSTTQPTLNLVSNSTTSGLIVGNTSVTGAPQIVLANSAGNTIINATAIGSSWGFSTNSTATVIPGTLTATVNASSISIGNSTVNTFVNSVFISTGNSTVNTFINSTAISTNGTLTVSGASTLGGNTTIAGIFANVTGDMFVRGNLVVNGSVTYTGNATGDIIPVNNNFSLGNTTSRWTIYSLNVDNTANVVSNNVIITNIANAASFRVGTSTVSNSTGVWTTGTVNGATISTGNGYNVVGNGISINTTSIWIGNNSISSSINATFFSGTANNVSFVGSVAAANVVSNTQLSSNLANYAQLSGATFTGGLIVSNNVTVSGNLTVTGTTLYANVTNLDVKDLNITVAKGATTVALTDGAGLTVDVSNIGFYYNYASNTWQSNVGITPSTNNSFTLGTTALRWSAVFANNITLTNSISAALVSATNVSATDIYGTVKTATQGTINHDSLANFDSNKHIDHTSVSISTANGIAGGGTIAATRNLYVVANNGIVANSTGVFVNSNTGIVSNSSGVFANSDYIKSLVNITNNQVTTSGTSAQNIDSFAIASFMGAEYLISVTDNGANNKYISRILVMNDGSTSQITEYGSITSNSSVGSFSATQNATHIALQFTPSLSATTVKYTRTVV